MEVMIRTNTGYWPVETDKGQYERVFGRYDGDVELNGRRAALIRVYLNDTNDSYTDLRHVTIFIDGVQPDNDNTCCVNVEGERGSSSRYMPWGDFTREVKPYTVRRPTLPPNKEPWDIAIDNDPLDWALRSVYADWLEEAGWQWLADGQRYQIANKLTPGPACVLESAWHEATWFIQSSVGVPWGMLGGDQIIKAEWAVPGDLFTKLSGYILHRRDCGSHNRYAKSWNGRREAEIALALALGVSQ